MADVLVVAQGGTTNASNCGSEIWWASDREKTRRASPTRLALETKC